MAVVVVSSRNSNSPRASGRQQQQQSWLGPWLLLVLGCVLGHWHGRYYSSTGGDDSSIVVHLMGQQQQHPSSSSSSSLLHNDINNNNIPSTACNCVEDGNGWNSIQVFYGKTDLLDDSTNNYNNNSSTSSSGPLLVGQPLQQQQLEQRRSLVSWHSQAKQDELVHALLRNKTHGFFVDLAANDYQFLSNTYTLERTFHWKGVCIEPNPIYWSNLTLHRPDCTLVAAVVGAERLQPVYFRFEAGDHGGIADAGFDNGKRWQSSSERRYTVPLLEILRHRVPKGGAPVDIDYLSLDVEGVCVCLYTCLLCITCVCIL